MSNRFANDIDDLSITPSSGNVFADLDLPDPELLLAKANLLSGINSILRDRKLGRSRAATVLNVEPAIVSQILAGDIEALSLECLVLLLNRLNVDVEIAIMPNGAGNSAGHLSVALDRQPASAKGGR